MRTVTFATLFLLILTSSASTYLYKTSGLWPIFFTGLFILAIYDISQRKHTILRNFPIIAHLRFFFEMVRPEIQQYFIESDTTEDPISRIYRSIVYERAKSELSTVPFGSELDFYSETYRWVNHSCFPVESNKQDFRVTIGNHQCRQPYSASLFNVSALSYGSISSASIQALGNGAKVGNFYLNTGEGGLSPYHLQTDTDLVWQLGTAYFGARDKQGYFDPLLFQQEAMRPQVKMIEIKISQGAKPGHGGILPGVKVTHDIAKIRKVPEGKTVVSPAGHTAFTNPHELCQFIQRLRDLSEGKPIGFKLCLGRREEFIKICEAIQQNEIYPDFITIDGGEGGTGAAPFEFINYVGSPLNESLFFAHTTLKQYNLRQHIKLIASGKVITAFNMFEKIALGADLCNSARGMMLALGCIQAYRCNTNKCPTGIATNNKNLIAGLDVSDKSVRVATYHRTTIAALTDLLSAVGLHSPKEIELKHISCRWQGRVFTMAELYKHTAELSRHERHDRHMPSQGEPSSPLPSTNGNHSVDISTNSR